MRWYLEEEEMDFKVDDVVEFELCHEGAHYGMEAPQKQEKLLESGQEAK